MKLSLREQILPVIVRLLAEGENVIWSGLDHGDKMQILMDITKIYQSLNINIKTTTEVEFKRQN
jgi:glycine cleavage system regulatory protein